MAHLVVISGASGGGKSTLVDALAEEGFAVVREAGRRLLREELEAGGTALPWVDPDSFLRRMLDLARADRRVAAEAGDWVFFDRSVVDAISGMQHRTGEALLETIGRTDRYHARVFLAPPWPEIYVMDDERRHPFASAQAEYHRLHRDYGALGYEAILLPKVSVGDRVAFVRDALGLAGQGVAPTV